MEIIPCALLSIAVILLCCCHRKQQKYIDELEKKVNHLGKDRVEVYGMMNNIVDRLQSLDDTLKHKKTEKGQHEYH